MVVNETKNNDRWQLLQAKISEEKIKGAFKFFRKQNIEPILIKGWSIAREYPKKHQRFYGDIDLCVSPELYLRSSELLLTEEARQFNIDLHNGLRHLDTVSWDNLFKNSKLVLIDDVSVRILRPEDHLRVLVVHWLTDGGAYKEKLLDIYYLIESNKDDFDWERCLGIVSQRRRQWICQTIGLVHIYYQLDVSKLPFAEETRKIPVWLIKALEKEWSTDVWLRPIHTILRDKRELWDQIKKRFPPNAIQATIDMEGSFDDGSRIYYQIGSFFIRIKPSIRRIYEVLRLK